MAKCDKCLRGTHISTTGVNPPNRTLKMDIGGAVLYVIPGDNGKIEVNLNSQSLIDGDYAVCIWYGERWMVTTMSGATI